MEGPDAFVLRADIHCKRRQDISQILGKSLPDHMASLRAKKKKIIINFKVTVVRTLHFRLPVGKPLMKLMF